MLACSPKSDVTALGSEMSPMGVDVPWVLMWSTSVNCIPESSMASRMAFMAPSPFGMGGGDVIGIGGESAAGQFGIDFGTTSFCMFEFLENDCSRAFAQNKTVAVFVERTGSGGRVIVAERAPA